MEGMLDWLKAGGFPLVTQTEAAECGLACVAMIAQHHGHEIDLPAMRRRYSTSLKGVDLNRLCDIADDLGLKPRGVKLELDQIRLLDTPAILHWDMSHFVVLVRATSKHLLIHDPAIGVRRIPYERASESFTGIAVEFTKKTTFRPVRQRETLSLFRLLGFAKGIRTSLIHILVMAVALELFAIASPLLVQWTMDAVIVQSDPDLLNELGLCFVVLAALQAGMSLARASAINWTNYLLASQWPTLMYSHFIRLPVDYFQKRNLSDLLSRFSSLQAIQRTLTTSFVEVLVDGAMVIFSGAVLFIYSGYALALVAIGFLTYLVSRYLTLARLQHIAEEQLVTQASAQSELMESARGIQAIKLFGIEPLRDRRFVARAHEAAKSTKAYQGVSNWFAFANSSITNILRVVIVWITAREVLAGSLTAGMLVASLAYANQILLRATSLVDKCIDWKMLKVHTERLSDIALTEAESFASKSSSATAENATLVLRNVDFRYSDGEPLVLEGVSLTINQGEAVALVGPSGSGKTTLAKIAAGLLGPESGAVIFGGLPIQELGIKHYRSLIGTVMQEDVLFSGTVADNIAMFDPHSTFETIQEAARAAQIDMEIQRLPMGYETLVGDMGSVFSGGQKQRILLARALYRKPRLLVLDEATSHLDVDNEQRVNDVVKRLAITRLIIAHRQETIAVADRVLRLEGGRLHDEARVVRCA